MNILLLTENWPPRVGGIERYLRHLMASMPPANVRVVAPQGSDAVDSSTVTVIPTSFFGNVIRPRWAGVLLRIIRLHNKQPIDVFICGKGLFEGLVARVMKRFFRVPYVVCTYAMEIETWLKNTREKKKLISVLQAADRITYINDKTRRSLLEHGVDSKKLVQVYPAVEERFFTATSDPSLLQKYHIETPYILTVARLVPRKGLDDLLKAFARTRSFNTSLVIVGDGPEIDGLQVLAHSLGLLQTVRFLTDISDEDILSLYADATLFALTPKTLQEDVEGFGIVYLEAAAAGLPVLGTKSGGVPEAVVDGVTGILVEEQNLDQIADAIDSIMSNPELASKLGAAGKKRAHENFTWQARGQEFYQMLEQLLHKS